VHGLKKKGRPKLYEDFKGHRREYMRAYRLKKREEKRAIPVEVKPE